MSKQTKQLLVLIPMVIGAGLLLWSTHIPGYLWVLGGVSFSAKVIWAWRQQRLIDAKAAEQKPN